MRFMGGGLMVLMLACGNAGRAADKPRVEEGYKSLFNGKDLTGWQYYGKPLDGKTATPDGRIEVKDGAIVMNEKDAKGKGGIKDLYTAMPFNKDFHLKLEFRASLKSDSGVYIRGPQLQVRDYIRRREQKQLTKFKNDDWNELDITVKGGTATCLCNGEPLSPKTMRVPVKSSRGIGLQAESGKFEFRNLRIKEAD
jgi:hypothetical protein